MWIRKNNSEIHMELQNTQNSLNDPEQRKTINLEVSKYLIFKAYLKTTVIKPAGTQVSGTEQRAQKLTNIHTTAWFLTKMSRTYFGKGQSLTIVTGKTDYIRRRMEIDPYLLPKTKINSGLYLRPEIMKLLEKNYGGNLSGVGSNFLGKTSKYGQQKQN